MRLTTYLGKRLVDLLEEHRIVVWYDREGAFAEYASTFRAPGCETVLANTSTLRARREAEAVYAKMNESPDHAEARANLLLYVPRGRGTMAEAKQRDPFEVFALAGTAFGDKEAELLQSLARQAMPEHVSEIDRLFADGNPTLAMLDDLESGRRWPLVREALETESPVDAAAQVLCREDRAVLVAKVVGCQAELLRLLESAFGFRKPPQAKSWKEIREHLGTFVLLSEFAFDLPSDLPESLSAVARAEAAHKERVLALCDRMRTSDQFRDGYIELAKRVETDLRLPDVMKDIVNPGVLDTFGFEERQYLAQLLRHVQTGDLIAARSILGDRRRSVWRHLPERALIWSVAERCVDFLETALAVERDWKSHAATAKAMVQAYARPAGWAELDRRQRLYEQSAAECADDGEILPLVETCRARYRVVALQIQERFLSLVRSEGWPPEGVMRQTEVFDRLVAPPLEQKERVAFFLGDSLRFEMGRDLGEALADIGEVDTTPLASMLPTTTPCGMAALMPGADGALSLVESNGDLVPALGTRLLKTSEDRMKLLRERYGDRFADLTLGELLSTSVDKLGKRIGAAELLVVRTQDIDAIGENLSLHLARKLMSEMLGDMRRAAGRLASLGFQHLVFSADHGHVLLPEVPPGDVVAAPRGTWLKSKRRCRLGSGFAGTPGTVVLRAANMGIQGAPEDICVPVGFKIFSAGEGYFHEGISLQECVVPAVTVRVRARSTGQGKQKVGIRYRSDKFTSRVIGLKLEYAADLFGQPIRVKVQAHAGTAANSKVIGEAADCDARDESTHEVTMKPGGDTSVPVLIESDYSGPFIEVRVTDPVTGQIWARQKIKNAMMD
ncbi:MAG: PglZ domain-containing protein [Chloroflexi bacterium]|nr:PglZ domain-containing protein [Chloroflexota bacterium]